MQSYYFYKRRGPYTIAMLHDDDAYMLFLLKILASWIGLLLWDVTDLVYKNDVEKRVSAKMR